MKGFSNYAKKQVIKTGRAAFLNDGERAVCPFPVGSQKSDLWHKGFDAAREERIAENKRGIYVKRSFY